MKDVMTTLDVGGQPMCNRSLLHCNPRSPSNDGLPRLNPHAMMTRSSIVACLRVPPLTASMVVKGRMPAATSASLIRRAEPTPSVMRLRRWKVRYG